MGTSASTEPSLPGGVTTAGAVPAPSSATTTGVTPPEAAAGHPGSEDHPAAPRRTVWTVLSGALGALGGLAPHVLHHVGPLVGTALVAGAGGTVLFGALGLAASVPMLLRLRRRFATWWAPAIALAAFTAMFLLSSFVIGPLISGQDEPTDPGVTQVEHDAHH